MKRTSCKTDLQRATDQMQNGFYTKSCIRRMSYETRNAYCSEDRGSCDDAGCDVWLRISAQASGCERCTEHCVGFCDIDEENSYISAQDQMYQKDFLKLVNKARAKAGLNSVELGDAAHNAAAAERAEELATTYSYVRPNVSATSPFLPRTASTMCPLARTIWPACPLRTPPWTVDEPRFRP